MRFHFRCRFTSPSQMKKFVPYLITAVVAIVAVVYVFPKVRPFLQKLPVVGALL